MEEIIVGLLATNEMIPLGFISGGLGATDPQQDDDAPSSKRTPKRSACAINSNNLRRQIIEPTSDTSVGNHRVLFACLVMRFVDQFR